MSKFHYKFQISDIQSQISKGLLLGFSFLIFLTACGKKSCESTEPTLPPQTANDLILESLTGEFSGKIHTAELAGQVQLILFFRSDDEACRGMVPDWNTLQNDFESRGFSLVGAIVDDRSPEVLTAELDSLDLSWPVGLATDCVMGAFLDETVVHAIPTAFLLSREGTVMRVYTGFEPIPHIREDIDLLLNDQELPDRNPKVIAPEDNDA